MSDNQQWKFGKQRVKGIRRETENAVLVGLVQKEQSMQMVEEYLDELEFLALTAGARTVKRFMQRMPHPDNRYFIGKGKLEEVETYVDNNDVDLVIFDDDLTGKQVQTIEKVLGVKIVDRSSLILDIFAGRAQTAQAMTQVELAQMQYLLPRLRGLWTHLERQRGGIGMRGPGEQEIETDRRIVRDKISLLKKKLEKFDLQGRTRRKNRGELIRVALVGYTNVGKSTLMNVLSKSEVFMEDKLFATLDTTVRKVVFDRMPFLLSDTVGFIRKLPHHLIESFKSTLDEVRESDLLVHVVDVSHPNYVDQINTVRKTLNELGASEIETVIVFNKMDAYREKNFDDLLLSDERKEIESTFKEKLRLRFEEECIFISARTKENINILRSRLQEKIKEKYAVRYPYKTMYW